jgi:hypothetical protein
MQSSTKDTEVRWAFLSLVMLGLAVTITLLKGLAGSA